jgi:N-dimethylarginine dimethylaminohydrolase
MPATRRSTAPTLNLVSATAPFQIGGHSMVDRLRRVVVKSPLAAFRSRERIQLEWESLGYHGAPDLDIAAREHAEFVQLLKVSGAEVLELPVDDQTSLDSIYAHDSLFVCNAGAILLQTGKPARRAEASAYRRALEGWGIPIMGAVSGDATAESGDMVWIDSATLAIGRSLRTNEAGVKAIRDLLSAQGVNVVEAHLPYWNGAAEVLHLMSVISMVDDDLALVYSPLMPVPLRELLIQSGIELLEVAPSEYLTLGCNVLALGPRDLVMTAGNEQTQGLLENAGCRVQTFAGNEIAVKGDGGPTCLTRPILRHA